MIKRISDYLTNRLVYASDGNISEREIYSYGFEYIFSLTLSIIVVIVTALVLDVRVEALGFIIGFATLRGSSGGYHSSTHLMCQITSFAVFLIAMLSSNYISYLRPSMVVMICTLLSLIVFELAPIEHKNRPFSHKEFTKFKRMSRIKVLIMSFICVIGYMFIDHSGFFVGMLLSMIIVTISVFLAYMLERRVL